MKNKLFYILASAVAILYFAIVWHFTINIPYYDDYFVEQNFLVRYIQSTNISEKIHLILEQHNEHRLLFTKLITLIVYYFSDKLNYSVYILIANIIFVGIGFFMCRMINNQKLKGLSILFIALLLFNGQNIETSSWAMAGLANIGIIFLAFASFFCLILKNNKTFLFVGLILSIITVFSNGNGMFIIPPLLLCFLLKKRYKISVIFFSIMIVAVSFYFYNYTKVERTDIGILGIIKNIHHIFLNLCAFIGLNFWMRSVKIISILVGFCALLIYVYGIWKGWYKENLFCYTCLTFLYLSAGAVSVSWLSEGMSGVLRYRIYSCSILALTTLLFFNHVNFKKEYLYLVVIFAFVGYYLPSAIYIVKAEKVFEWKKISAYNWNTKVRGIIAIPSEEPHATYLKKAEFLKIYKMPKYTLSDYVSTVRNIENKKYTSINNITYKIENIEKKEDYIIIEGFAYLNDKSMNFSNIFITFNEKKECTTMQQISNIDRIEHCGFFAVIDTKLMNKGSYQIGIKIKRLFDKTDYFIETEDTLSL